MSKLLHGKKFNIKDFLIKKIVLLNLHILGWTKSLKKILLLTLYVNLNDFVDLNRYC